MIITALLTAAPDDYSAMQTLLTFTPGVNVSCATMVPIIDDAVLENSENLSVMLNTEDLDVSLVPSSASVTIVDNDSKIVL